MDTVRALLRRPPPSRELTRAELVEEYIRSGHIGMAVAVFRGLEPAERATLAAALQQRQGDLPHPFEPRQYGSKKACWCGARLNDEIHTNRPPRPPRPGDRR